MLSVCSSFIESALEKIILPKKPPNSSPLLLTINPPINKANPKIKLFLDKLKTKSKFLKINLLTK